MLNDNFYCVHCLGRTSGQISESWGHCVQYCLMRRCLCWLQQLRWPFFRNWRRCCCWMRRRHWKCPLIVETFTCRSQWGCRIKLVKSRTEEFFFQLPTSSMHSEVNILWQLCIVQQSCCGWCIRSRVICSFPFTNNERSEMKDYLWTQQELFICYVCVVIHMSMTDDGQTELIT